MSFFEIPQVRRSVSILVGLVFGFSGLVKLMHVPASALAFEHYPFVPSGMASYFVSALGLVEVLLAGGLLSGQFFLFFRKAAMSILAIFLLFLFAMMVMHMFNPGLIKAECPCYGPLFKPNPALMMVQDALLFFFLVLIGPKPIKKPNHFSLVLTWLFLLALAVIGHRAAFVDPLVVKLHSGYEMRNLPSLDPDAPNHDKARVVVITDRELTRDAMQRMALAFPNHQAVMIQVGLDPVQAGPEWTVMQGKPNLIPLLVRHLPTCFTIEESKVGSVWYGYLPTND